MSPTRLARLAAVAAIAVASLTACSAINPITTQFEYAASDGFQVRVDGVLGQNLLIAATAADEPAMLVGSFSNDSAEDVELTISMDGDTETVVDVPARSSVFLGPADDQVLVTGLAPVQPGLLAMVNFRTDSSGAIVREIPVMDGTLAEYAPLVAAIPVPEPSPEPSPSASPSPEPSASPEASVSPEPAE